jgi:nucleotide-binding universal stress UspA family protein
MAIVELMRRLRDEFTAMPGLRLTETQAQRLCSVDAWASASALRALVSAGFLRALEDGSYGRSDVDQAAVTPSTGVPQPPWRRILCLVNFDSYTRESFDPTSHSALRYATTLAVTHRARITALHVLPGLPLRMAFSAGDVKRVAEEQQQFLAEVTEHLRKRVFGEAFRGLIDVHVAVGTPHEELLRMATEVQADLIVLGRRGEAGSVSLSRLSEVLQQAVCPVLIVHPSGRAAVA